ncbi:hypothetical protein CBL_09084 [Carabus blaptoides fortunei]
MFAAALDRPLNTSPRIASEPAQNNLGPISINCNPHSTTSPKSSPNGQGLLTTATAPLSPPEDDISVTASPVPSPPPPQAQAFNSFLPSPSLHGNHLFNNALAASLFLNAPLLPPPGQWLYSQLYPSAPDWPWLHLRHPGLLPSAPASEGCSPTPEANPDSSGKITEITDVSMDEEKKSPASPADGSVNLTVHKGRKAAVTLVKQKDDDDVTSSDKTDSIASEKSDARVATTRHSDVWRPY